MQELKLLSELDHQNIVRFVRSFRARSVDSIYQLQFKQIGVSIRDNTQLMLVSELCTNGDLFDYIRNIPTPSLHDIVRAC